MRGNVHRTSIGSYEYVGKAQQFGVPAYVFTISMALVTIVGQVGQNVVLPLWYDAQKDLDGYFILLYTCVWFSFVFGVCTYIQHQAGQCSMDQIYKYTQPRYLKQDFFVAFFTALNGIFVVFAAPSARTPAFLQTIFSNVLIPFVLVIRFFVLGKVPNCVQFLCAMGVVIGLFITAYPSLFDQDPTAAMKTQAKGVWRVMWPLCFLFGFLPAALYTVFEEKYLQATDFEEDEEPQPISLFLFIVTVFQTLTFLFFFWVDLIPVYGFSSSFSAMITSLGNNVQQSWGQDGQGFSGPLWCWMFVLMYCLQNFGAAMLLRYTEGATWTALVQALVTPLGELFWVLFNDPKAFGWAPSWKSADWYALGGLVVMMPCVYIYNLYSEEEHEFNLSQKRKQSDWVYRKADETSTSVNLRPTDKTVEGEGTPYTGTAGKQPLISKGLDTPQR